MSENMSTTAEGNPEVTSEGDKECASLTFGKHAEGTLVVTCAEVSPGCGLHVHVGVAAKDENLEMARSRSSGA